MGHHDHHKHIKRELDLPIRAEYRLWWAVGGNMALTLAQIIGGVLSGSLSLIADALHNFGDAASLLIALIAIRIGKKPPNKLKTFGYKRAETIAALINLITLIIIGFYLCYEAILRFFVPEPIIGWLVVMVAMVALVVDIFTAVLTYAQSKNSMNIRAAFLHNVTDALASVGVMISGILILLYDWVWTDAGVTLLLAGYILYQGFTEIPKVIHLLMEGAPEGMDVDDVIQAMQDVEGVTNVHHVHIWQIDESRNALEAHVVLSDPRTIDPLKTKLKAMLHNDFAIGHSALEFEEKSCQLNAK